MLHHLVTSGANVILFGACVKKRLLFTNVLLKYKNLTPLPAWVSRDKLSLEFLSILGPQTCVYIYIKMYLSGSQC